MSRRYPRYISKSEREAKIEASIKKLQKKKDIKPVVIKGRDIAKTWWGKSWNLNLERYSDYSNRISRGRSYVKQGAVIDLQIKKNNIEALVQGTRKTPYKVNIEIDSLKKSKWKKIKKDCEGEVDTLSQLIEGDFSNEFAKRLFSKEDGLFPKPSEIDFLCTCPDWASMCKHIAATLYAVGRRLDDEPSLLFLLRDIDFSDLVSKAIKDKKDEMLKNADKKSKRVIDEDDISDMFDIDI